MLPYPIKGPLLQLTFFNSRTLCIFTSHTSLLLLSSPAISDDTNSIPKFISVGLEEKLKFTRVPAYCMMMGKAKEDWMEIPLAL